jgi:hypothetical protein
VVSFGGTLTLSGSGNLTLPNGAGNDLDISGTFILNGPTLTQNLSSLIRVTSGGVFQFNFGTMAGDGDLTLQNGGTFNFAGTSSIFLTGTKSIQNNCSSLCQC